MAEPNLNLIGVTGGKGGTGKSTFAALLANKLAKEGKKVLLVDLDVECPNLHLLLAKNLGKKAKEIKVNFPKLDKNKCKKCGRCVEVCKENAIFQIPGKFPKFVMDLCNACGACMVVCPNEAIKKEKKLIGKIYKNEIAKNFTLITGEARAGLEETSGVVLETKKFALNFAQKNKKSKIIFDTAAGTHCPVISALLGLDFAYTVTEPTPLGAHDLDLILKLLKRIKVKSEIVLNQSNLGNKKEVEKIAKKYHKKIKIKIPYSKKIVNAYAEGKLIEVSF
jgi:MinD superfamily P-loop ATPase